MANCNIKTFQSAFQQNPTKNTIQKNDRTHDVNGNSLITKLKIIIIKHYFIGQILINTSKQHSLINVYFTIT